MSARLMLAALAKGGSIMRIEQLYYFLEIVKTGSMNAAALNLHLTHQSLNRSMKSLEQELGAELFVRTAKGTRLSPAGEKALEACGAMINIWTNLQREVAGTPFKVSPLKGTLTIATTPITSAILFSIFPTAYARKYPFVHLHIQERNPDEVIDSFRWGQCDLALATMNKASFALLDPEAVDCRVLLDDDTKIIMNRQSPLAQSKSLSIKTLLQQPLIFYSAADTDRHWLLDILEKYGTVRKNLITNSAQFFLNAITAGDYISPFSQRHWDTLSADTRSELTMIPFRHPEERELFRSYITLLISKKTPPPAPAQALIQMLT